MGTPVEEGVLFEGQGLADLAVGVQGEDGAGAIVQGKRGSVESKLNAFKSARVPVADVPWRIGDVLRGLKVKP